MTSTNSIVPAKSRRTIVKAAAWSIPVISAAVGAPGAAASPGIVDLGAIRIDTTCNADAEELRVFTVCTGAGQPLPLGTLIFLDSDNWGAASYRFEMTHVVASPMAGRNVLFTVTREILPGSTTPFWVTGVITDETFTATVTLPAGYIGTGAKSVAVLSDSGGVCNAT